MDDHPKHQRLKTLIGARVKVNAIRSLVAPFRFLFIFFLFER